jgi:2-aminoadipate transaminase
MRLNFSASDEGRIREGIRRIGQVVAEQMDLYGTLTGEMQVITPEEIEAAAGADDIEEGARVVELRRRRTQRRSAGGA